MKHFKMALLLTYICIASLSAAIITPALPNIAAAFHLQLNETSWVVSLFLVGYVIGQLIYGPLAKRFGALKALRAGLVLNLIGVLICLCAVATPSYGLLLFGRLLTALGAASGLACTFMLMHDLLDEHERKIAMAYSILSFTLGIGLAVFIGGLMTSYFHWQACFWILFFHGLLMLILTAFFHVEHEEKESLHPMQILIGYWRAIQDPRLVIFALVVGFVSAFSYGYSAVAPLYTAHSLHMTAASYGNWNLINMIGMLAGGLLSARAMKHWGPKKVLFIGLFGMLPCCISLLLIAMLGAKSALWFFITTMLAYLFGGFLFPSGAYFSTQDATDKANASSMMSFVNMLSAVLVVIVIGYLPGTVVMAFSIVIGLFLLLIMLLGLKSISRYKV